MFKKIAIGLAVFLFVSAASAGVFLSIIDWNEYRQNLEETAFDATGVKVDLAGDIGISFLPTPSLNAEAITLRSPDEQTSSVIATAQRIGVELALGDLLGGDISFNKLELVGLELNISENDNGEWVLQGWPQSAATDQQTNQNAGEADGDTEIKLDQFELSGAKVNIISADGKVRTIEGIDVALAGVFPNGPVDWAGQAFVEGQKIEISGRARPVASRSETSLKADLKLEGGEVALSGRYGSDVGLIGRVTVSGDQLPVFLSTVSKLGGSDASYGDADIPFLVDLQIEGNGGVYSIVSKQLDVNQTRGRLDLTFASMEERSNLTGSLSLGIIDTALWQSFDLAGGEQDGNNAANAENTSGTLPIAGTLDTTIEGIVFNGDTLKNVDTVIRLDGNDIEISKFQALMPGGTGIAAQMKFDMASGLKGDGGVSVISGQLPVFMKWLGVSVHDNLPAGRLATAKIAAKISVDDKGWQVRGVKGNVDTSAFTGSFIGGFESPFISSAVLNVDQINLDAYLPKSSTPQSNGKSGNGNSPINADLFPDANIDFTFSSQRLLWNNKRFSDINLKGKVKPKRIDVTELKASYGRGSLTSSVAAELTNGNIVRYELDADLYEWPLDILSDAVPASASYIRDLNIDHITGNLSLAGPQDNLRLIADVQHGRVSEWALSGDLGLADDGLSKASLRGKFKHQNVAGALQSFGIKARNFPVDVTLSMEQGSATSPIDIKINGRVENGQIIADTRIDQKNIVSGFSYDHPNAEVFLTAVDIEAPLPNPADMLRLKGGVQLNDTAWTLSDFEVRNGNALVAGNLSGEAKRLRGDLAVQNWQINLEPQNTANRRRTAVSNGQQASKFNLAGYDDYDGLITLSLNNVEVFGQQLFVKDGQLAVKNGQASFTFGENSRLNNEALNGQFNLGLKKVPTVDVELSANYIDIATMLVGVGYNDFVSGRSSAQIKLSTKGQDTVSLVKGLNGSGNFKGAAGALAFLDIPSLINDIQSATSGRNFLGLIGNRLAGGKTTFGEMETNFSLDSGVALIEKFEVNGNWGQLGMDGQVNLVDQFMDVKGALALANPVDAPVIPVNYRGSLNAPAGNWQSRALERFVLAGIERRLRSNIFKGFEQTAKTNPQAKPKSAGSAVFESAFGLLSQLQKKQQQKKAEQEKKKAEEAAKQGNKQPQQ